MYDILQLLAATIAIIFTPIGCWFAYKNIPEDRLPGVKTKLHKAKEITIFLFVLGAFSALLVIEIFSTEPMTRFALGRICLYTIIISLWISINSILLIASHMLKLYDLIRRQQ